MMPRGAAACGLSLLIVFAVLASVPQATAYPPAGNNVVFTGYIEIEQHHFQCPSSETTVDTSADPGWAIYENIRPAEECHFSHGEIFFPEAVDEFWLRFRLAEPHASVNVEISLSVGDAYVITTMTNPGPGWREFGVQLAVPEGTHQVQTWVGGGHAGIHMDRWAGYPSMDLGVPWENLPSLPQSYGCTTALSEQHCETVFGAWNTVNETYQPVIEEAQDKANTTLEEAVEAVKETLATAEALCRSLFDPIICNNVFGPPN